MSSQQWSVAIHGGAGNLARYEGTGRIEEAHQFLDGLIEESSKMLAEGATAIDTVTHATVRLEDAGLFHAGKGSSVSTNGVVELDASIMKGTDLTAGAVTLAREVKNAIKAARLVMEKTPHVMLGGEEVLKLAREHNLDLVSEDYFVPCDEIGGAIVGDPHPSNGTVGAVARDKDGHYAAATSTGGTLRKAAGRIGDTPIIGAGTYAKDKVGAVSSTGYGEYFIREVAAYQVISRLEQLGEPVGAAVGYVIDRIHQLEGEGGIIAIGPRGEVSMVFNTTGMYRASIDAWARSKLAFSRTRVQDQYSAASSHYPSRFACHSISPVRSDG